MENSSKYKVIVLPTDERVVVVEMAVRLAEFTMKGNAKVTMPDGTRSNDVIAKASSLMDVQSEDTKKLLSRMMYPDVSSLLRDFKAQGAELENVGFPKSSDVFDIGKSWILNVIEDER